MTFDYVIKALVTGLSDHAHTAVAWVQGLPVQSITKELALYNASSYATTALTWAQVHPVQAGVITLNFGLAPFLGLGWMPALAVRAAGFGNLGVVAGELAHADWVPRPIY